MSDPYCYPGTTVLRNKFGITDPDELRRLEEKLTRLKTVDLRRHPVAGAFDLSHLQGIHRRLFEDLYDWAGEIRTVNIHKGGFRFAHPEHIEAQAAELFGQLAQDGYLQDTEQDRFIDRAAFYLGEINALHPFREGNGRTQREFLRQLAAEAGWEIDWDAIDPEENNEASAHAMTEDHELLAQLIAANIQPM